MKRSKPECFTIAVISFFCFITSSLYSSNGNDKLVDELIDFGFENIITYQENNSFIICYENRIFRSETDAIEEMLLHAARHLSEFDKITLVPCNMIIPICKIEIDLAKYLSFISNEIEREVFIESISFSSNVEEIRIKTKSLKRNNKSELKTDILIYPHLKTRHGDYDKLLQVQTGINPTLRTTLGKGISVFAQMIIPLYDNLAHDSDFIRPGILALNTLIRLPSDIFLSTTIGQFANVDRYGIDFEHRYGIDWELQKYFNDGQWQLGLNIGYTGDVTNKDRLWKLKTMNTLTYFVNATYRVEIYNLTIAAKYGQFIYKDKSLRVDVNRQFGEVNIGFYTILSSNMKNGGFNISIPIFPSKYYKSPVRVLPAKSFDYEYRAKRLIRDGQMYNTGYKINDFRKNLTRDYLAAFLFK